MQWDLCVLPGSEPVPGETIPDTIGDSTRNNDGTQDTVRAFAGDFLGFDIFQGKRQSLFRTEGVFGSHRHSDPVPFRTASSAKEKNKGTHSDKLYFLSLLSQLP